MFKTIHQYYIYILTSKKNGTLYIGVTNDLERRVLEHKQKITEGFTSKYNVNQLVYFESFQYVNHAIKREKQLKKWNRQWKINLIEEGKPNRLDLASDWYEN
jgi:putative endonuclease